MNTKSVANELGISNRTVLKWVRQNKINVQKNEHGHYVFTDIDVKLLQKIREERRIRGEDPKESTDQTKKCEVDQSQIDRLNERLDTQQRLIEQKANEIVNFQVLQHRKEIDELISRITQLEKQLLQLDKQAEPEETLTQHIYHTDHPENNPSFYTKKRKHFISSIFGF